MTKGQNPGKSWRGDRWSPVIGHAIDRRLRKRRNRIAELLAIDLDEQEWRNDPVDIPDDPDMSREARFMKWRETPPTSGSLVYRIDLAIEEITGELRGCWGLLRDVNCARSSAQVYRRLEHIVDHADDVVELFEESDPETKAIIEDHYPGGWLSLESSEPDTQSGQPKPCFRLPPADDRLAPATLLRRSSRALLQISIVAIAAIPRHAGSPRIEDPADWSMDPSRTSSSKSSLSFPIA